MADNYGIFVPGLTNIPEKSVQFYLQQCQQMFREGFDGQSWMEFRVPMHYRDNILATLKKQYPQYDMDTRERTFIWIWGGLNEEIEHAVASIGRGTFEPREKHRAGVLDALKKRFPSDTFDIMEFPPKSGEEAIVMNWDSHKSRFE